MPQLLTLGARHSEPSRGCGGHRDCQASLTNYSTTYLWQLQTEDLTFVLHGDSSFLDTEETTVKGEDEFSTKIISRIKAKRESGTQRTCRGIGRLSDVANGAVCDDGKK